MSGQGPRNQLCVTSRLVESYCAEVGVATGVPSPPPALSLMWLRLQKAFPEQYPKTGRALLMMGKGDAEGFVKAVDALGLGNSETFMRFPLCKARRVLNALLSCGTSAYTPAESGFDGHPERL